MVTWGELKALKGVQLRSQPVVDSLDEEEEEERTSKQDSCSAILIWPSFGQHGWFQDSEVKHLLNTFPVPNVLNGLNQKQIAQEWVLR